MPSSQTGTGRGDTVDVVFPCLNEEAALPDVFRAVPAHYRVIVVDNGSTDASGDVARQLGATVVIEPRKGYGAAVHAGVLAATSAVVAVMDCDGSLDPAQLSALVAAVVEGRCDLAVGRRQPVERRSWPWHARWGNRLLALMLSSRVPGLSVTDLGPVRVGYRLDLLSLAVTDRRSGYPVETLIKAAKAGWRIQEFDLSYRRRAPGTKSKVSGSIRGTITATRDILRIVHLHGRGP
ncbi:glycosyltransferase family 2 protein [Nakamurella sp. UYEF19]|uniref:glycosyltransferase family 2 protein n=1 Tax=Nakamurella sp. UYEF19 TaxID=1756392 RepID=UPI003392A81B